MVLYEDLRVYTFWRTEAAHYRSQQMPYRKTGTEWELLGDLAMRLWHEVRLKRAITEAVDSTLHDRTRHVSPMRCAWITSSQPKRG